MDSPAPSLPPAPVPVELTPLHPGYPSRLRSQPRSPATLWTCGGSLEAERVVAIVGSRDATADALDFAKKLAGTIARAGGVVVSGGAAGVDTAAHRGALEVGGRTWVVAPTGHLGVYPDTNRDLFAEVALGPGAMLWPFPPASPAFTGFLVRNQILVTLADAVVVVQAGADSGALNAATCARRSSKPLWVCPAPPWLDAYLGSRQLLEAGSRSGARPLHFVATFLASLGLAVPPSDPMPEEAARSSSETAALRATSTTPLHLDAIASRAALPAAEAAVALLTLALENVVVEGPPGFFRRRDGR